MTSSSGTTQASWEYYMPQHRERAGRYIRESNYALLNSTTIESGAKLVNEYCEKQGYICEDDLEWREAISSTDVPYMERDQLQAMLAAAKKHLFDVLVITEIRAIGRQQVEVLVIYDMLQKYGVRLETVKEKFGEDGMSKAILSLRAMFSEIEVEQLRMRVARGKMDRVLIGQAPKTTSPFYTHNLVDTDREVKGRYVLNVEIAFVDDTDKEWTRVDVARFFCELLANGGSLNKTARILNNMGIPSAQGKLWKPAVINRIVRNPLIYGQPYANRYIQTGKRKSKNGKQTSVEKLRPFEEWIALPACEGVITKEIFDLIQFQIDANRSESLGNNHQENPGLARSRTFCGICGAKMRVMPPPNNYPENGTKYLCKKRETDKVDLAHNHRTQISLLVVDAAIKEKIAETLSHPELIRQKVEAERKKVKPPVDPTPIHKRIAEVDEQILTFFELAKHATTKDMVAKLAQEMNDLEKQKRDAQKLLHLLEDSDVERLEVEAELVKFEAWADRVGPFLTDPEYLKTAGYDELLLAVRILGIRCVVFPTIGGYKDRLTVDVTVPEIMKKLIVETRMNSLLHETPAILSWSYPNVGNIVQ